MLASELRKVLYNKAFYVLLFLDLLICALLSGRELLINVPRVNPNLNAIFSNIIYSAFQTNSISQVFGGLMAIIIITQEIRHKTLSITLVQCPHRFRLWSSKVGTIVIASVILGVFSLFGGGVGIVAETHIFPYHTIHEPGLYLILHQAINSFLRITGSLVLLDLFWATVAFLILNQTAAIMVFIVYSSVATNVLALNFPSLARWIPEGASQSITPTMVMPQLGWQTANSKPLTLLVGVTYLFLLIGSIGIVSFYRFSNKDF